MTAVSPSSPVRLWSRGMPPPDDAPPPLRVNRAPVLTLWAAVVAERMGHSEETALTLGRALGSAVAGACTRAGA